MQQLIPPKILSPAAHDLIVQEREARAMTLRDEAEKRSEALRTRADQARRQEWLKSAVGTFTHDDGSPDFAKISVEATRYDPEFGLAFTESLGKMREQAAKARIQEIEEETKVFTLGSRLLSSITDQESLELLMPSLERVDPDLAKAVGPTFDPARIQTLAQAGLTEEQRLARQKALAEMYGKDPATALMGDLSDSRNQDDVNDAYAAARLFLPSEVVTGLKTRFGATFEPGFAERIRAMAITPEKEAELAGQQATRDVTMRGQDIGAETTRRGQDIGAETTRRGQDITAETSRASQAGTGPDGAVKLSAGQQQDLEVMLSISDMAKSIRTLGDEIKWSGVGPFFTGTIGQKLANVGYGTPKEISLRNQISNIKATIAKLRGGTAFTAQEQKLLESYTPTIDDGDEVIKQKLKDLETYIETKRKNMIKIAKGDLSANEAPTQPASIGDGLPKGQTFRASQNGVTYEITTDASGNIVSQKVVR